MSARARCRSPRRPAQPPARTRATSSSPSRRSRGAVVALLALAAGLAGASVAVGVPAGADLPAVTVSPIDRDAPNGGQWFTVAADRGETVEVDADLMNPSDTAQTVSLYLADLDVDGNQVAVGDRGVGVGAWGGFDEPTRRLAAHEQARVTFAVTVPADAEPGDHLGAVVAESQPTTTAAGVQVVKRIAARLYVTVPGDAEPRIAIVSVRARPDRGLLPRHVGVAVIVRNTGNVRLHPKVTVNGRSVVGPPVIVSSSAERYDTRIPLSIWGGRRAIRVRVESESDGGPGPTATAARRVTVVPWWILLAAFLAAVGFLTTRELRRRLR